MEPNLSSYWINREWLCEIVRPFYTTLRGNKCTEWLIRLEDGPLLIVPQHEVKKL